MGRGEGGGPPPSGPGRSCELLRGEERVGARRSQRRAAARRLLGSALRAVLHRDEMGTHSRARASSPLLASCRQPSESHLPLSLSFCRPLLLQTTAALHSRQLDCFDRTSVFFFFGVGLGVELTLRVEWFGLGFEIGFGFETGFEIGFGLGSVSGLGQAQAQAQGFRVRVKIGALLPNSS